MDDKTYLGSLAEAKCVADLTRQHFHVFTQFSGKAPFDLVACKDSRILRISVKGTRKSATKQGSYAIDIGRIRSSTVHKFDPSSCDLLAVFVYEIDTIYYIPTNMINGGRQFWINTSKHGEYREMVPNSV